MNQRKLQLKYAFIGLLGFGLLLTLDQWTKYLAVRFLAGKEDIPLIPNILELHYLENRGAAFGIMQNNIWVFVILTFIFLIIVTYIYLKMPKSRHFLPLNIIVFVLLAGAIGNLIDRIRLNYVVDFIYFSPINFPVFNVADIYVTLSAAFLFFYIIFYYKEDDFKFLSRKK